MKNFRIIYSMLCLLSIFSFSWQISSLLIFIGMILFDFKEVLIYGFLMDLLYGLNSPFYLHILFLTTFFILYLVSTLLKGIIRK